MYVDTLGATDLPRYCTQRAFASGVEESVESVTVVGHFFVSGDFCFGRGDGMKGWGVGEGDDEDVAGERKRRVSGWGA